MMKKFLLLLGFFVSTFFSQAQNKDSLIILNTENPFLSIGKSVYFFEDKTALLSINDILKPENQKLFKKSENEILNFNTTFSRVWVKFTVQNQLDDKIYLEFSQALASYIDFYKPNEQQKPVLTTQTGIMRSFKNREIDYNFFLFELNRKNQAQTYYFSVRSDAPVIISLAVCNLKTLFENRYFHILFFGIFSGLIIIMFFYNLFLFFSFKDKSYLYYCLYIFVGIFFTNYLSGNYGYKYNLMTYFSNYLHFFVLLMSITISLQTKRTI
jgi:hypothetical protein